MKQTNEISFYSGTSNIVLPEPNKQAFPVAFREKSRLEYYASLFNSVEVNSSFYKVPMASTVKKWADSVPENFKFTFKLWQEITHNKGNTFNPGAIHRFIQTIDYAGTKKGCLLVQFPPAFTNDKHSLEKLLSEIRQADPEEQWNVCVEFRNKSWYRDDIYAMLEQYAMALVLHDMPSSATPLTESALDFVYLRFHGPQEGYRGSYTDDFLHEYARYINDWLDDGKTVYAYFNNTMGDAVKNLVTLNRMVSNKLR